MHSLSVSFNEYIRIQPRFAAAIAANIIACRSDKIKQAPLISRVLTIFLLNLIHAARVPEAKRKRKTVKLYFYLRCFSSATLPRNVTERLSPFVAEANSLPIYRYKFIVEWRRLLDPGSGIHAMDLYLFYFSFLFSTRAEGARRTLSVTRHACALPGKLIFHHDPLDGSRKITRSLIAKACLSSNEGRYNWNPHIIPSLRFA